jgi:hypothetical protein
LILLFSLFLLSSSFCPFFLLLFTLLLLTLISSFRLLLISHAKNSFWDLFFSLAVQPPWALVSDFGFRNHFTDSRTPWTSDRLVARSLPKQREIQTQNKHIRNIHALCGIRTHDPGFRESEDSTCFRPVVLNLCQTAARYRAATRRLRNTTLDRSATVTGEIWTNINHFVWESRPSESIYRHKRTQNYSRNL